MAAGDLCTRNEVKTWLGISGVVDDGLIDDLITRCSKMVKDWLCRDIGSASYTEKYNGTGTTQLPVANFPIISISSLKIYGVTIPAASSTTAYGYTFKGGIVYLQGVQGFAGNNSPMSAPQLFSDGNQNVEITYTAGFASVPASIQQACIELVGFKYNQKKHIGKKSDNMTVGGMGTSYQEGGFPPEVLDGLRPYRKVVPT